jgi:hypothetical protein
MGGGISVTTEKTTKGRAAAPAQAPKAKAKAEAVIYVGPTLPGGVLHKSAVYRGGELPAHIKALKDGNADLAALFVPASKLGAFQQKLADPASIEAERVRRVVAAYQ